MKEKITLEEEIEKRRIVTTPNWAWAIYSFLVKLPFLEPKYNASYKIIDDPRKCETGCFLIWNHLSRRDYLFIKRIMGNRKFNMVAGYTEFFRSHLAKLFKAAQIIPKKPFYNGDKGFIFKVTRLIRKGGVITFSPEGTSSIFGDNQPIAPGTAGFLKKMGVPVYCADFRGQYLSSNKVDITDRKGTCEVTVYKLFDVDDLKEKSVEEIDTIINDKFTHDDYVWNMEKQYEYKGKNSMTSCLEDMCYKCPKCEKEFEMISTKDNKLYCKSCGNGFELDNKYNMKPLIEDAILPSTPSRWVHYEREEIIKEIRLNPNYEFRRHYKIGGLPKYKTLKHLALNEVQGEVDFIINHEGVHFVGTRNGEPCNITMSYKDLYCPCVSDDLKTLTFYPKGESTDIIVDDGAGGKIILLVQEMHRLHDNTWKNLPKFNYMYQNLEKKSRIY